ncbi:hypothetical protein Tco_1135790 [Tanacetum coccineum]
MSKKVEVIELSDSSDAVSIEKGIEGSSKPLIPPFGSAKRPRPEVVAPYLAPKEGGVEEVSCKKQNKEDEQCQKFVTKQLPIFNVVLIDFLARTLGYHGEKNGYKGCW